MTAEKVIRLANEIKPNALSDELKLHYLSEVEGMVQTEVMLLSSADTITYTEDDLGAELIVRPPHDKLYLSYLIAMIDFSNGEYNKYTNTIARFNTELAEYTAWYARRFHPIDGKMEESGYYVSAYAIAVMHGFNGTEKEWLESLRGAPGKGLPGDTAELRYSGTVLEWKYVSEDEYSWRVLVDTSVIADSIESAETAARAAAGFAASSEEAYEAAKAKADAAAKSAQDAANAAGGGVLSFNGRGGYVEPASGDYTAEMVGADPEGAAADAVMEHVNADDPHPDKYARIMGVGPIAVSTSDWTAYADGGYAVVTAVEGVTVNDKPIADLVLGFNESENDAAEEAWGCVKRVFCVDGAIVIWGSASTLPSGFTYQARVVR